MIRDLCTLPRCAAIHEGERLLPEQIAADPRFHTDPDGFLDELRFAYGDLPAVELWLLACRPTSVRVCPACDGGGILFDYSSPDPQQWWDRTCPWCFESGVITEDAAA